MNYDPEKHIIVPDISETASRLKGSLLYVREASNSLKTRLKTRRFGPHKSDLDDALRLIDVMSEALIETTEAIYLQDRWLKENGHIIRYHQFVTKTEFD